MNDTTVNEPQAQDAANDSAQADANASTGAPNTAHDADHPQVTLPPPQPGGAIRSLIMGIIAAVALGMTLLTWALSLMFMLGLFFFMLFGLLIGAIMFRGGSRSRPMPRKQVVTITAIVVTVGWLTTLAKECADFQDDFVETVMSKRGVAGKRLYIPNDGYHQVESEVRGFISNYLHRDYPLGSWVAYLQYAASGRSIRMDIPSQISAIDVPPRAAAWVWWTRVLLALPLFFLTTYSVTAGLARLPDAAEQRRHY